MGNYVYYDCYDDCWDSFVRIISDKPVESYTRCYELKSGDEIYINNDGSSPILGNKHKDYPATVIKLDYKPKKWWQFWKKKELLGYVIKWL